MGFTLVAIVVGFGVALAAGGRLRNLAGRGFSVWLLLPVALVLQVVLEHHGFPHPYAFLVVSYLLLIAFGVANVRQVGMWLVVVGFALNALVITVDRGMPVSHSSIAGIHYHGVIHQVKHHEQDRAGHHDRLMFLADTIAVPPIHEVLSFGDMILAVGIVDVIFNLLRPRRRDTEWEWAPELAIGALVAAGDGVLPTNGNGGVIDLRGADDATDTLPLVGN